MAPIKGEPRLVACLTPGQEQQRLEPGMLRELLGNELPGYMIPSSFVFLETLADPLEIERCVRDQVRDLVAHHVGLCVCETLLLDPVHFLARQPVVGDDLHLGAFARAFLDSTDPKNPVRINQELHNQLGHPCGHRGDPAELEDPERPAVLDHLAFPLEHIELDIDLPVDLRREPLDGARRDGRVPHDELGNRAPRSLDPERQGHHIEQQ